MWAAAVHRGVQPSGGERAIEPSRALAAGRVSGRASPWSLEAMGAEDDAGMPFFLRVHFFLDARRVSFRAGLGLVVAGGRRDELDALAGVQAVRGHRVDVRPRRAVVGALERPRVRGLVAAVASARAHSVLSDGRGRTEVEADVTIAVRVRGTAAMVLAVCGVATDRTVRAAERLVECVAAVDAGTRTARLDAAGDRVLRDWCRNGHLVASEVDEVQLLEDTGALGEARPAARREVEAVLRVGA